MVAMINSNNKCFINLGNLQDATFNLQNTSFNTMAGTNHNAHTYERKLGHFSLFFMIVLQTSKKCRG